MIQYEFQAVNLANSNLSSANEKCEEYQQRREQERCFARVSDKFSGISSKSAQNPPEKLIDICLVDPTEKEWLACLCGNAFSIMTEKNRYFSKFANQVRSNEYRKTEFCDLFIYSSENPGLGQYYSVVGNLRDEVCKAD